MKRFLITKALKTIIKNNQYSLNKISQKAEFNIKNILYRNISINEKHLIKLSQLLNINLNLKEIKINYSKNLGKYGISHKIKPIKKDKNLAEFIGIMLGDGNIHKNAIKIAFDKRKENYIKYTENLFKNIFNIKLKKYIVKQRNIAYLYYYNKNLIQKLLNLGLQRGNKIKNNLGIPSWIKNNKEFSKSCIRGLIDTDGCIYRCKREKQTYIKFTNFNIRLLKDFKELTEKLNYSFAKANKNNFCLYRKQEVVKFINQIKPFKAIGAYNSYPRMGPFKNILEEHSAVV